MTVGVGLESAFNQNGPENNDPHAVKAKEAESFKKNASIEQVQHAKIGNLVAYTKGIGKIVKKEGAYVTVYNESAGEYDHVHVGETYVPGDMISMGVMNQLWDQMQQEVRMGLLSKANIQEPLHFVSRSWDQLPRELKEVLKKASYVSVGYGVKEVPKGAHQDLSPAQIKQQSTTNNTTTVKPKGKPKTSKTKPTVTPTAKPTEKPTIKPGQTIIGSNTGKREWNPKTNTYDIIKPKTNKKVKKAEEERLIVNKYNTRYGARQVTEEEALEIYKVTHPEFHSQTRQGQEARTVNRDDDVESSGEDKFSFKKIRGSNTNTVAGTKLPQGASGMSSTKETPHTPKESLTIEQRTSKKSDVEHGLYGGVVSTDTPFEAKEDYEEDERTGERRQLRHERYEPSRPAPTVARHKEKAIDRLREARLNGE